MSYSGRQQTAGAARGGLWRIAPGTPTGSREGRRSSAGQVRWSIENCCISLFFICIPKQGNSMARAAVRHRRPRVSPAPSPTDGSSAFRVDTRDWLTTARKPSASPRHVRSPQGNPRRESPPAPPQHSGSWPGNLAPPIVLPICLPDQTLFPVRTNCGASPRNPAPAFGWSADRALPTNQYIRLPCQPLRAPVAKVDPETLCRNCGGTPTPRFRRHPASNRFF